MGQPTPDVAAQGTGTRSNEGALRRSGGRLLLALYGSLAVLRRQTIENQQTRNALDELVAASAAIVEEHGELELRVMGGAISLNGVPFRLDLDNYASFPHVLATFRRSGVGVVRMDQPAGQREWRTLLGLLTKDAKQSDGFQNPIQQGSVGHIVVGPPLEGQLEFGDETERKLAAKRTYAQSAAVAKKVFTSATLGRGADVAEIKHAVQNIVDQVLNNETCLVGLSTLKDYDDYTFVHSVNVCIFCVAIGRRLGLSKKQLFDLGLAGLLHDVGMSRVPVEIASREGNLTDEEWPLMHAHTWLGALTIFRLREVGEIPFRSMVAAYEHHMKVDQTGYPTSVRPRKLSVFSKIVAVADAFDAATNSRFHGGEKPPDVALKELTENVDWGFDPVLVKALINLTGIYPVGTCVILDTYELALVHEPNSDSAHIHRPIVRILSSADGVWLEPTPLHDLSEVNPDGTYQRSIIKVTKPERYGVTVGDYFV